MVNAVDFNWDRFRFGGWGNRLLNLSNRFWSFGSGFFHGFRSRWWRSWLSNGLRCRLRGGGG
jgi:hypothetical protein